MSDRVFIVAGGPSLRGFPFEKLRQEDTIAVNVSAFDVPEPTYCITADSGIFRKLQEGYFQGIDTTWVVVSNPEHCTMKFRDGQFKHKRTGYVYNPFTANMLIRNAGVEGIGFTFKDFRTGYNSGFCGFQLAVLLRYRQIFLLGFDMNTNVPKDHYHDRYGKDKKIGGGLLDRFYENFRLAFEMIEKNKDIDVKIYSCSKISRLNQHIPYVALEDIIP